MLLGTRCSMVASYYLCQFWTGKWIGRIHADFIHWYVVPTRDCTTYGETFFGLISFELCTFLRYVIEVRCKSRFTSVGSILTIFCSSWIVLSYPATNTFTGRFTCSAFVSSFFGFLQILCSRMRLKIDLWQWFHSLCRVVDLTMMVWTLACGVAFWWTCTIFLAWFI